MKTRKNKKKSITRAFKSKIKVPLKIKWINQKSRRNILFDLIINSACLQIENL